MTDPSSPAITAVDVGKSFGDNDVLDGPDLAVEHAPAIHVQGLEKSYKELEVLRGVDFDVARGSIFALLGSNGAGKTTVVKILSTLLKADAGTVSVNGFDVAAKPDAVRQSISLTGQFAAVDEILTGRENLIMIARLRHLAQPRQVADERGIAVFLQQQHGVKRRHAGDCTQ